MGDLIMNKGEIYDEFIKAFPQGFDGEYTCNLGLVKGKNAFILVSRHAATGRNVALKLYRKLFEDHRRALCALRDVKYLSLMNHQNVMTLSNVGGKKTLLFTDIFIEMEITDASLDKLIRNPDSYFKKVSNSQNICMLHILSGLAYIHSGQLVHRNLQPKHVLLSASKKWFKIADFSHARKSGAGENKNVTRSITTSRYSAPEIIINPQYHSSAIDIYAAGLIFIEILLLKTPFLPEKSGMEHIKEIFKVTGRPRVVDLIDLKKEEARISIYLYAPERPYRSWTEIFPEFPSTATEMLDGMLQFSSSRRITADQALDSEYLAVARSADWKKPQYDGPPVEDYPAELSFPRILNEIRNSITKDISTVDDTNQLRPFLDS